ncbi:MAG: phage tail assembly chaperone [Erythrobacter sp.]
MNATFAAGARRRFPLAARLLGWRPDEFWRATPAELALALADPNGAEAMTPPTRETIARMMERDDNAGQV